MKPLTLLLFAALAAVACEKNETPDRALRLSASEAILRGDAGAGAEITVTSERPWEAHPDAAGFTVEPLSGDAGATSVTITAAADNDAGERTRLGSVTFSIPGTNHKRALTVLQSPRIAPQTVMLYMSGSGNLLKYFKRNIEQAGKAFGRDMPGDGRFLAMIQPEARTALILELRYDPETKGAKTDTLRRYTDIVTTRQQTIARLLGDMARLAPADRYGLILGSHATGWVPSVYQYLTPGTTASAADSYWHKSGPLETRWFGSDSGVSADIPTLAEALLASGVPLDYLIFDACLMSSVEALYDLRACARRIVAAPTEVMGYGFPYERIVPKLFLRNGAACDLVQVCSAYHDFYLNDWQTLQGNAPSGCIALAECAELEALARVMKRVNGAKKADPDLSELQSYENLSPHIFYDLGHYVALICKDPALLDEFDAQLDRTFPREGRLHTPTFYSAYNGGAHLPVRRYSGVSVSEPSTRYGAENRQTAWWRDTH